MCQISAILLENSEEKLLMENVTEMEVVDNGNAYKLMAFFEDPRIISDSTLVKIDFTGGKIYLKKNIA